MNTKIHFTNLLMLAHEMGRDRKAFPYIENTFNLWTDDDIDSDIALILCQLPNCFYAPSECRIAIVTAAYYSGLQSENHTIETIKFI